MNHLQKNPTIKRSVQHFVAVTQTNAALSCVVLTSLCFHVCTRRWLKSLRTVHLSVTEASQSHYNMYLMHFHVLI